ncbi:MAG: hypothetical protein LBD61_01805, partial [Endomicrobium sp.]|nr:hypothetical protein [Endomicrobium sp.]
MIKTIKKVGTLAVAVSLMTTLFSQESFAFKTNTVNGHVVIELNKNEENLAFIRALTMEMKMECDNQHSSDARGLLMNGVAQAEYTMKLANAALSTVKGPEVIAFASAVKKYKDLLKQLRRLNPQAYAQAFSNNVLLVVRIQKLEQQVAQFNEQDRNKAVEIANLKREIDRLKKEHNNIIEKFRKNLAKKDQEVRHLLQKKSTYKAQIKELKTQETQRVEKIGSLSETIAQNTDEIKRLKTEVSQKNAEMARLNNQIRELSNSISNVQRHLENELEKVNTRIAELLIDAANKDERIKLLEEQLNREKQERGRMEEENKRTIDSLNQDIENLRNEISTLKQNEQSNLKRIEELESQIEILNKEIVELKA